MTRTELKNETSWYLANGTEVLQKAGKKGKYYEDAKYVKKSGHTLYSAMLIALDEIIPKGKKGRNTEKEYRAFLTKRNKNMLKEYNNAYFILHQSMGYDGILSSVVIRDGIKSAKAVINWVLRMKKD